METRVALLGIVVENPDSVEPLNRLLHQYKDFIIGRMGIPYRERKVNIISIVLMAVSFVGILLTQKLYKIMEPKFARLRHEPSEVLTRKAAERQAAAEALTGKENETQEPGKVLTQTTTETAQKKDEEK